MSENRPEDQPGTNPAATTNDASGDGQYMPPTPPPGYPGVQDQKEETAYPSHEQQSTYAVPEQETPAYSQQSPYSQPPAYGQQQGYPGYGGQQGYPAYGQAGYPVPPQNPGQAMGIAGLITSFFFSVVGLVLSIVGLNQSRKAGMGNVPAVIGIVVGSLGTIFAVLMFIFIILAASTSGY